MNIEKIKEAIEKMAQDKKMIRRLAIDHALGIAPANLVMRATQESPSKPLSQREEAMRDYIDSFAKSRKKSLMLAAEAARTCAPSYEVDEALKALMP